MRTLNRIAVEVERIDSELGRIEDKLRTYNMFGYDSDACALLRRYRSSLKRDRLKMMRKAQRIDKICAIFRRFAP